MFQGNKAFQIFWKTSISYPVRNVRFSENLACFDFLKNLFWDSPFCLINDEVPFDDGKSWKLSEDVNLLWESCALPWDTDTWIKTASHVKTLLYGKNPMQLFGNDKSFNLMKLSKQPLRGVHIKRYFENMQQIYRKTPMQKCDFNTAKHFECLNFSFWIRLSVRPRNPDTLFWFTKSVITKTSNDHKPSQTRINYQPMTINTSKRPKTTSKRLLSTRKWVQITSKWQ